MNLLRSPLSWLGASSADLAKSALLTAVVLGGSLLAGGEAKASGFFQCDFLAFDPGACAGLGDGRWVLNDKRMTWEDSTFLQSESHPGVDQAGTLIFAWDESPTPDDYSISLVFDDLGANAGAFKYQLEVLDPANSFSFAELDVDWLGTEPFNATGTKEIANESGGSWILTSTSDSDNDSSPISGKLISVTDTWDTCPECNVRAVTNTYNQTTQVPGPLPLLGVGAAFGYSRRLRNRLKVRTEA